MSLSFAVASSTDSLSALLGPWNRMHISLDGLRQTEKKIVNNIEYYNFEREGEHWALTIKRRVILSKEEELLKQKFAQIKSGFSGMGDPYFVGLNAKIKCSKSRSSIVLDGKSKLQYSYSALADANKVIGDCSIANPKYYVFENSFLCEKNSVKITVFKRLSMKNRERFLRSLSSIGCKN